MLKLNIGVGPFPIHQQHLDIMGDVNDWTLVDKFVVDPRIKNWDALDLPIEDGSVGFIYSSHLLEHLSQSDARKALLHWRDKLCLNGKLYLNVPDLEWASDRVKRYIQGIALGYYNQWEGEHGIMSIVYGSQSHEGEYHKSGYYRDYLYSLLSGCGYSSLEVERSEDAHDMGVLIARGIK